ncbi:MAG: hypothetical protein COV70_01845 [Parcubacteria group bacterium CG11_big_fil_rev_8_21_14_0_20_39_22]|nr:MAG: hypothetical protein COV70_01845 [Parcubacteria group bacterium CG11_big_fil_rev_8_21_14_0_20_39_22]
MAREPIATGEYYHVFNRGVDKRKIFNDSMDSFRFLQSMILFNSVAPVRSLFSVLKDENCKGDSIVKNDDEILVEIVAYCLNPNHFHLILRQSVDGGISEFMKRLGGGYTLYFNEQNGRSGSLFQGKYKYTRISTNKQLLHVSAYVNLNDKGHKIKTSDTSVIRSSWSEYTKLNTYEICEKNTVLGQFKSKQQYEKFAKDSLEEILIRKNNKKLNTLEEKLYHTF